MEHVRRNLKFRDISANRILLFLLPVSFQWCDRLNETNRECFVRSKSNRLIHRFYHSTIYYGRFPLRIIYENRSVWEIEILEKILDTSIIDRKMLRFYFLNCVPTREKPSDDELLYMCREKVFIRIYICIYVDVGGRALCLGEMRANK